MKHTVKLLGQPVPLRFTFEALCLMSERHKVNVFAPETYDTNPHTVSVLVWGGVLHERPKITLSEVQQQLDLKDLRELARVSVEALMEALPAKSNEPGGAS